MYARNILAGLARLDRTSEYVVLLASRNEDVVPSQENFSSVCWAPQSAAVRVPFFQTVLPWWLTQQKVNVLVSPFEYTVLAAPCPVVLGMQNLCPYSGPSSSTLTGQTRNLMIRNLAWLSVRRAAKIFFLSDASRRIICNRLRIGMAKSVVIPYGLNVDGLFVGGNGGRNLSVLSDQVLTKPYILSVSSVLAYKDFESLLCAFAGLLQRLQLPHRVVIAGPLHDKPYLATLQSLISTLHLDERVVFLGEVPHSSVGQLYSHADVMVLPSHTETFGMPIIEAMACGTPVIASDLPALREVGAHAGRYYSPGDSVGLSEQLERVLVDKQLRISMVEAGAKRASQFSWDAAARDVLTLIREVASEK